jgi:hypothetical protein
METDIIHMASKDREWYETFYFNLYDKANDLCMFMRIGLKPNRDERLALCYIMMPDGSLIGMRDQDAMGGGELEVSSLRFVMLEAGERWRLSFDGSMSRIITGEQTPMPVHFDLEFLCLNPLFNYLEDTDLGGDQPERPIYFDHIVQFGRVSGTIAIGEREVDIYGLGERSHYWGTPNWSALRMWVRLDAEFSEDEAINVFKVFIGGQEESAGFLRQGGRNIPIVHIDLRTVLDKDGTPRSLRMSLTDSQGIKHQATAEVLREALLPFHGHEGNIVSVAHEALAEFKFEGRTGYGIAEFLVRKG